MNIHFLFTRTQVVGGGIAMSAPTKTQKLLYCILNKNTTNINRLFATLLLSAIVTIAYSQDNHSKNGIFDINGTVTATARAALVETDGFGTSHYRTEKLPNGNLKVRYTYDKPSVPNPLFITYAYEIEQLPSGDFAMDMQAAMPPTTLYIDTNAIQLSYTGDKIVLPNHPTSDHRLTDVNGTFTLTRMVTLDTLLTYKVSITNRKFAKKDNITLDDKTYQVYTHTYDFVQKAFVNEDLLISEWQDQVEETYLMGYGLVNQRRQGSVTPINVEGGQVMEQKLISELIKIK